MTESDRERHRLAQDLLFEALELPQEERAAFLESRVPDDPDLRDEVHSLLAALDRESVVDAVVDDTSDHLPEEGAQDQPRAASGPAEDQLGEVGSFRLRRLLGQGGMGSVYLADRVGEDYEQQVALKLVRTGFFDAKLEERFREERRILALLRHPGIAQLIDGGVTPEGRPYFALEFVEGTPLLDHCEGRELTLESRLRLFLEICEPVQYAHRQLVIHRDLKPANILVTRDGHVKLLDFGVAKLLHTQVADAHATRTSPWITPAYASPEQIRGEPVGTAVDVYALGIILYEMLTGVRPYEVHGSLPPSEVERIVCEVEPTRPSKVVTQTGDPTQGSPTGPRGTGTQKLSRRLSGDLDTIVLKALAKAPERRYASVADLAEDVRRHLDGRPVLARPDTVGYRVRKFATRNRTGVIAGAAIAVSLILGMVGVASARARAAAERNVAESQADRADQVASLMLEIFQLSDPARSRGDTVTAREILDRGTERIQSEFEGQPLAQADLLSQVAEVYRGLGRFARAEELARTALFLRETEAGPEAPVTAASLGQVGALLGARGRLTEAIPLLERGVEIREASALPNDTVLATMQAALAERLRAMGEFGRAQTLWERSLETRLAVFDEGHPLVAQSRVGLASALHEAGEFGPAQEVLRDIVEANRATQSLSASAATAAIELGSLLSIQERYAEAASYLEEATRIRGALYEPTHPDHIEARLHYVGAIYGLGRYAEAAEIAAGALRDAGTAWNGKHPTATSLRVNLARALLGLGEPERALAIYDTVLVDKHDYYGGDHNDLMFNYLFYAEPAIAAGNADGARGAMLAARGIRERLSDGPPGEPGISQMLEASIEGRLAALERRHDDAERHFDTAVSIAEGRLRESHRYRVRMVRERASWWIDRGRASQAAAALEASIAAQEERFLSEPGAAHPMVGQNYQEWGRALLELGQVADAREKLQRALRHYAGLPRDHVDVVQVNRLLARAS